MHYPIVAEKDGVKIAPEHMEKEKFYHCIFNDNVLLIFKDEQEFLHCYEIEPVYSANMLCITSVGKNSVQIQK